MYNKNSIGWIQKSAGSHSCQNNGPSRHDKGNRSSWCARTSIAMISPSNSQQILWTSNRKRGVPISPWRTWESCLRKRNPVKTAVSPDIHNVIVLHLRRLPPATKSSSRVLACAVFILPAPLPAPSSMSPPTLPLACYESWRSMDEQCSWYTGTAAGLLMPWYNPTVSLVPAKGQQY